MKVVIAIDSFKGSLTSIQAGHAAKTGILNALPDAEVIVKPLADGGEGTVEALVEGLNGTYEMTEVTGPLGAPVTARYGIMEDQETAIMEMAEASGIILVIWQALMHTSRFSVKSARWMRLWIQQQQTKIYP